MDDLGKQAVKLCKSELFPQKQNVRPTRIEYINGKHKVAKGKKWLRLTGTKD